MNPAKRIHPSPTGTKFEITHKCCASYKCFTKRISNPYNVVYSATEMNMQSNALLTAKIQVSQWNRASWVIHSNISNHVFIIMRSMNLCKVELDIYIEKKLTTFGNTSCAPKD